MAGSPRLLQAFYRLYFGFWIPALVWASTWWPLVLMYWMARNLVMVPFNVARPKYLRVIKANYARVLGLPALIEAKERAGRPKDLAVLPVLRAALDEQTRGS